MNEIIKRILLKQKEMPKERSLLVGISGVDGSGKGFITSKLTKKLQAKNIKAVAINVDGWLNLPHIRFNPPNPAAHFYENGLRFEEMFEQLIFPLKQSRTIKLIADFAEETATEFRQHEYVYENVDVILIEGIFLFKKKFQNYFDLKIWIECSFETALQRAISRSQENLSPEETVKAYRTIYFPAQKIHFVKDNPRQSADLIFDNN